MTLSGWWMAAALAQQPVEGGTIEARPGRGITLIAPGGAASMNLRTRFQLRASETFIAGEDALTEISVRRARLAVGGHAWDEDLTYLLQVAFTVREYESDLPRPLYDAYVNWAPTEIAEVRAGQAIVPFSRGRVTSSAVFQLVDRSIVVSELNLDRDVGLALHRGNGFGDGRISYAIGLYGGEGRNRLGTVPGYLGVVRVSARPLGAFDDLAEGDLARDPAARLALGANVAYNANSNRAGSSTGALYEAAHFDYLNAGADLVFKCRGLYVTAEALARTADEDVVTIDGITEHSRSAWGWFLQGGQMVAKKVEVAARYSDLRPFEGTDPDLVAAHELGGGASWYLQGHALKIQTDYFHLYGDDFAAGAHQVRTELQFTL